MNIIANLLKWLQNTALTMQKRLADKLFAQFSREVVLSTRERQQLEMEQQRFERFDCWLELVSTAASAVLIVYVAVTHWPSIILWCLLAYWLAGTAAAIVCGRRLRLDI